MRVSALYTTWYPKQHVFLCNDLGSSNFSTTIYKQMAIRFQVGLSGLPKQFMIFRSLQLFWWIERWILVNPDTQRMRIRENSPYKTGVYGINVGRSWPKNGNHTGVVSSGICEVVGAEVVSSFLSIFSSIIAPDHLPTKNRGPSGPNQRERMKILPTSKKK